MKTFIIAEAGANHNRDWKTATDLILCAADSGSDAVKFQTYSSETLYAKNTPDFAGYTNINQLIKDIELPRTWQKDLKLFCDDVGIEFMSTPFDEKAVDELYDIGVKRFKIAGFEATDPRIVQHAAKTGLPLIITTGIKCDISMMKNILSWINDVSSDPDVTFLHGNHAYPTPISQICLGQIGFLRDVNFSFPIKIGISDHTEGILIPPIAVSLGAEVVEKHFTLDRKMKGPDHPFAIEPSELSQMVQNIRDVEISMGVRENRVSESEKSFIHATRSIVTSRLVRKGERVSKENITTMRPWFEDSVPASKYLKLSAENRFFQNNIEAGCIVKWSDIYENSDD
jgi:sialic acid synthase SpsE